MWGCPTVPWLLSPGCGSLTSTEKALNMCEGTHLAGAPDLCPDWWCSCCCVSWCVICDSDPNSFQSGPFAFLSLVSTQLVYSFEEKKLFFLVTSCLRVYLSAEIALINPQDKYRNKQIKGEEEGQEKVWQGKTWGVGQVFILQLLLWVIAVVDLFFPQWFL